MSKRRSLKIPVTPRGLACNISLHVFMAVLKHLELAIDLNEYREFSAGYFFVIIDRCISI